MGILDQFRKSQKKEEAAPAMAEKGFLLADIFKDKSKFHLFGKFLEQEGDEELALRVIQGNFEDGDIDLLEEKRRVFVEKLTMAEKAVAVITKENLTDIAGYSPDFVKIVNLICEENAVVVIKEQMMGLAFADEDRFMEVHQLITERQDYKNKQYKFINDKVEKILKGKNISQEEYLAVLAIEDEFDRAEAMKQLAERSYGKFKTFMRDRIGGRMFNYDDEKVLQETEAHLRGAIAELDEYNQKIGESLYLSVQMDAESQRAILSGVLGDKEESAEKKVGFQELKKTSVDEDGFEKDWNAFKTKFGYGELDSSGQDSLKGNFLDNQKVKNREKSAEGGFWSRIKASLMEGLIEERRAQLA